MLLGARVLAADGTPGEDLSVARVGAGVLLAPAGAGGGDLTPFAAEHFPFMNPHFDTLATRALVVVGDRDDSPLTVRGPDWMTDAYTYSPGAEALLTLHGAEHALGGIPGYEVAETPATARRPSRGHRPSEAPRRDGAREHPEQPPQRSLRDAALPARAEGGAREAAGAEERGRRPVRSDRAAVGQLEPLPGKVFDSGRRGWA